MKVGEAASAETMAQGAGLAGGMMAPLTGTECPPQLLSFRKLDGEWGNPSWEGAAVRILIVRLSPFSDVDRSTSHLFLFSAARSALPAAFLDFAFLPTKAERRTLGERGLPLLFGRASGRGAADFDLLLVSNAYSLELINLLPLLSGSGLALRASERRAAPRAEGGSPLVILGGSNARAASALFEDPLCGTGDSYVDGVFFGEGEVELPRLLEAFARELPSADKRRILLALAEASPALSLPGLRPRAVQARLSLEEDGGDRDWETSVPVLPSAESSTARLTISRGCPSFCSFCMEGFDRKPWREPSFDDLVERAKALRLSSGAETLELASYNFNARADAAPLIEALSAVFPRVNVMSQRADILARTPGLLDYEMAADKRSFTLGVEGLSERMRAYYRKGLDAATLEPLLAELLRRKAREIKLFYIISGLETEADLDEFSGFAARLAAARSQLHSGCRILFSAGYLVRMPGTPLFLSPLEFDVEKLAAVSRSLKERCAAQGFEYRLASFPDEYCLNQALVSGDRKLFPLLERLSSGGFLYEGSLDRGAWAAARSFLWEGGQPPAGFVAEKAPDAPLPLSFVEAPVSADRVRAQYEACTAALSGAEPLTPGCFGGSCEGCGACPPGGRERQAIESHALLPVKKADIDRATSRASARSRAGSLLFRVELPAELASAPREYLSSWVSRRILSSDASQSGNLISAREALFSDPPGLAAFPSFSGSALFRLTALDLQGLSSAALAAGFLPVKRPADAAADAPSLSSFRATLALEGLDRPSAERAFSSALAASGLPATMSRREGRTLWSVSDKGLKKKLIAGAELSSGEEILFSIEGLRNFSLSPFIAAFEKEGGGEASLAFRFASLELSWKR